MTDRKLFMSSVSYPEYDIMTEAVEDRTLFYRLGESELFKFANENNTINGKKLSDVIPLMAVESEGFTHITADMLDKDVQYEIFDGPRYKLSCKKAMRNLLDGNKVVMAYSDTYKIPTCIPYIIQGAKNNARVIVNVSDFLKMDQYGKMQIVNPRSYNGLMAVLFAACSAYRLVSVNKISADVCDCMVLSYAELLTRALNSLVVMDPITKEKVKYLSTEFALVQMYGTEEGLKTFYRYQTKYFPKLSKIVTESIDAQFGVDSFDKMSLFVLELKRIYPSFKGLNDYLLYDKWIKLYGASTTMSIDYLGYHLYTICMVLFESPLVSRLALEPAIEKSLGASIYKRLQLTIEND